MSPPVILLFGKNGQVGWELQRALAPLGTLTAFDSSKANFGRPDDLVAILDQNRPNIIVNAAAYTAVDAAETHAELAHEINARSVGVLAQWAAVHHAWLVHYSTDYVFPGLGHQPHSETDQTGPLSVYGASKLAGEAAIRAAHAQHLIFRTSWVYALRGKNFAKTILKLARDREDLRVIADQWGAPTSAELIADATALALHRILRDGTLAARATGTYHLAAAGETNWCEYARYLLGQAVQQGMTLKARPEHVLPITTAEYPLPARRPLNSRLDCTKIQDTFGIHLPVWQHHVKRLASELCHSPLS